MTGEYNKAIVAFLGGVVTLVAAFGIDVSWASPELISGVGSFLTAILVWLIPNAKPAA